MTRTPRLRTIALAFLATLAAPVALGAGPAQPARPTLEAKPRTVVYGTKGVMLTGVIPSRQAGQVVSILARACRFTEPAEIGTVRTKRGGVFRYAIQPMLNTAFSVRWSNRTSRALTVGVKPQVMLKRLGNGRYRIEVATTNGVFLDGRRALVQRAFGKRWRTVARATLEKASGETAITVLSAQTVSVRVPAGSKLRAFLPQSQATCYRAATSASVSA